MLRFVNVPEQGATVAKQKHCIILSPEALQDLDDIHIYISNKEGQDQADVILDKLEAAILSLEELPKRGNIPPELIETGINRYHEMHVKPWRIIYEVSDNVIYIHWIFDSRRDIASQISERILRP